MRPPSADVLAYPRWIVRGLLVLALAGAVRLSAQQPPPARQPAPPQAAATCAPTTAPIAEPCELDSWGGPVGESGVRYPEILRSAQVGGAVRVRFVVDSNGVPIPSTLQVLESSHDLFIAAVRTRLPTRRFAPPRRGGRPVPVRYEESFRFIAIDSTLPRDLAWIATNETVSHVDRDERGVPRTTIAPRPVGARVVPAPRGRAELRAVQRLALLATLEGQGAPMDSVPVLCVGLVDGSADRATLRLLATATRRTVTPKRCPRTYASMVAPVTPDDHAPAGWVDPTRISVVEMGPWTRDAVLLRLGLGQGTGSLRILCVVSRVDGRWAKARCGATGFSVS